MINIDFSKYETSVLNNLDKDNVNRIVEFLIKNKCDYINELLEDYLDIFTFDYMEFVDKFNKLNLKYDNKLISNISENMNIIDEFYNV